MWFETEKNALRFDVQLLAYIKDFREVRLT